MRKFNISNQWRSLIVYVLLISMLFILITTYRHGEKQDAGYYQESAQYEYAVKLLSEEKGEEAVKLLRQLVNGRYGDSYEVIWKYGMACAITEDYPMAIEQLLKAQEIRPALITNGLYMVQFGEVLARNKDYQNAELYLQKALELNLPEELRSGAEELLKQIQKIKKQ
ncbi:hypothetical protein P9265_06760 [Schinkia azotoformans]|uniref:tetratricopeptide repeat protein n=1 Tax=Schinkia azotoformans TaxID=1454 RepID=UPI002E23FD1D|nr:hypothetical protein [Schinkia azotoformans]